ncbi:Coiled-coil domain-containing protein 34 [Saguinus oedipus]|uniref:Coiled-coil domain-containing protein 34 n=1 Tax=Saguinus oedipus TaxID=9490 RepID=A0ABQ9UV11_SAGOE|nr:Coiled-coil domain-containing protein 34 [Saguinus oedipus]
MRRHGSAGPAGRARPRRGSASLNLAGQMWAAGRWGPTFPPSYTGLSVDCRPRSRPSSGSFAGLEVVRSPSPPLSCSNSTRSLLSPLCHQSFQFDEDDEEWSYRGLPAY